MQFDDKVVMITGASRGIGAETARVFARAGARVALLARGEGAIADLAGELGPDKALAIPCDVARFHEVQAATDATRDTFGPVDILINNAGVIDPQDLLAASDPDRWGQVIDINLKGVYYGMRAVVPEMVERGGGTILTISSGAAHRPLRGWSHYCASKAGAKMLTEALHLEYGDRGIRAMGLSPGTVATQMQKEIKAAGLNQVADLDWSDHIPPDWPAKTLLWMAGPAGDAYLGQEISLREPAIRSAVGLA